MAKKKYVNVDSLNLRAEPNSTAKIITELKRGTTLSIVQSVKEWDKIEVRVGTKDYSGFVANQFLSSSAPKKVTAPAELPWIAKARSYIGLAEIPGKNHNNKILEWWISVNAAWFNDDETPWCGAFVGGTLKESGYPVAKNAPRALAWNDYGVKLPKPAYGSIVVFNRSGGGHVGFVVGKDKNGNLMVLGGNQANAVNIKPFAVDRVVGYVWPANIDLPTSYELPLLSSDGKVSTNEA